MAAQAAIGRWASDGVIVLEVPAEIRHARVASRTRSGSQVTRSSGLDASMQSAFDDSYQEAFATVLDGLPFVRIVSADSGAGSVLDVIEKSLAVDNGHG
jgi:hypothetical protein